jgi:hypothetical protein
MGNKIQILLDIDDFFSILLKKTQIFNFLKILKILLLKLFFFEKIMFIKNGVDPHNEKKSGAHVCR